MRKALLAIGFAVVFLFAAHTASADSCSATKTCGAGPNKTCNGTSSCQVLSNGVRCDGVTTTCSAACSISYDCPVPPFNREWLINCSGTVSCSSNVINHSVTCDGVTRTCQSCQNNPPFPCPF